MMDELWRITKRIPCPPEKSRLPRRQTGAGSAQAEAEKTNKERSRRLP